MIRFFLIPLLFYIPATADCQVYTIETGTVQFFAKTPFEDIKAVDDKPSGTFDLTSKALTFRIQIENFQFSKKLMRDHFNKKYLESERYPTATFSGKLVEDGSTKTSRVVAEGVLTIHGVSKEVAIPGTLNAAGDQLTMKSVFSVLFSDYGIQAPTLLWKEVAHEVEVTLNCTFINR